MKERNYKPQQIHLSLIKILDKIKEVEKERTGKDDVSYRDASLILAKKITDAGGIKEIKK